jgi:hypothetical protein
MDYWTRRQPEIVAARGQLSRPATQEVKPPTFRGVRSRSFRKNRWRATAITARFPEAVRENEGVVSVSAVLTWVLPSGVAVGR